MQRLVELEADPMALEQHYREAPQAFEEALEMAVAERPESPVFQVWYARLSYEAAAEASLVHPGSAAMRRLVVVGGLVLLATVLAKLPDLVSLAGGVLPEERFYTRNAGLIVLPLLAAYFIHYFARSRHLALTLALLVVGSCVYINLLPEATADTVVLAMLHLPFWLWGLLGVAYVGTLRQHPQRRLRFLRYNGEMLIYTALILIAGGILSGLTIVLFQLIGLHIEETYMRYVGVCGAAATPIVATLLATTRYGVTQRIAPVIARLFGPLALVTLVVYLGAILTRATSPFDDREMLAVLNVVLLAVLALIVFSISEHQHTSRFTHYVSAGLLAVAVMLDLIALSAIVERLLGGLTPNRLAVLGANVLILVHLALLLYHYVRLLTGRGTVTQIGHAVTGYLTLYVGWAALVTFGFPLLFGFA